MRTIPVDFLLHDLVAELVEYPADSAPGCYADSIARCIRHDLLAEQWAQGAGAAISASRLLRRLDPEGVCPQSAPETRAIEVAVARRLSDIAFAMLVEQDAEATARATTLLRAAQAIVGLTARQPAEVSRGAITDHGVVEANVPNDQSDRAFWNYVNTPTKPPKRDPLMELAAQRDDLRATLADVGSALGIGKHADIVAGAKTVRALADVAERVDTFFTTYKGPCAPAAGTDIADAVKTTVESLADAVRARDGALDDIVGILKATSLANRICG